MKILFWLSEYPAFGGIEKVTTFLSNKFVDDGLDVHILSFYNKNPKSKVGLSGDVKVHIVPVENNNNSWQNEIYIRKLFAEYCYDIVIFQDCYADSFRIIHKLRKQFHFLYIVAEHNTPLCQLVNVKRTRKKNIFHRLIIYPLRYIKVYYKTCHRHRQLLKECDKYIILSKSFTKELKSLVKVSLNNKVYVIGNPLTLQTKEYYPDKEKNVVFVGRIVPDKGYKFIPEIWKKATKDLKNWTLTIVGDGEGLEELKNKVGEYNLQNVFFEGFRSDVVEYYQKSSILMMTSIFEGLPLVLTEAMSCGCVPICFSSYSSVYDIIDSGENGILIAPFDVDQYAYSLRNLMDNHEMLKNMSQNCIIKSKVFDINNIANKWYALFNIDI